MNKLALLLPLAAACGSDEPAAITRFLEDFHASRYSRAAERAAELDAAAEANPTDGPLAFDRALAHNWHVSEWKRDPEPDPAAIQEEAASLLPLFQTAAENNPNDHRVGCFLGLQLLMTGQFTGDDELVQAGRATLERAVESWPEFNLFCLGLAYDQLPASHPDYARAVDAAFDTMDACYGQPIDRDAPDITPYLHTATDQGPKRACWNDRLAPHNVEGFFLWMGDLLVKQGRVSVARAAYHNATLAKEYPDWPYRSLLEDRLGADLDAKAALYQDADPANDPPFAGSEVGRRCVVCHAATAAE